MKHNSTADEDRKVKAKAAEETKDAGNCKVRVDFDTKAFDKRKQDQRAEIR